MTYRCIYPPSYMVSPCGFKADFFEPGQEPKGWTNASKMSDTEVAQMMVRRMMANGDGK